jgi:phenylalanine-4-hydroxylase
MLVQLLCTISIFFMFFEKVDGFRLHSPHTLSRRVSSLSARLVSSETENGAYCPRVSLLTEIPDKPGSLHELLRFFWKYDINLTRIESRPSKKGSQGFNIQIDFDGKIGEWKTDKLLSSIKSQCSNLLILDEKEVPWFPRHISDLNKVVANVMDAGDDLQSDHPGFNDPVYRNRRTELAKISLSYKYGDDIPTIRYTPEEIKTWGLVYSNLESLQDAYACKEYREIMPLMEKHCGYSKSNIPQVKDISDFLRSRTGFQLVPVTGLLSSRDFLSGLAFRTFFSTQYIRHSSRPLYTPEPDICHELMGHAPMFADSDFADFSQEIGLASLGASDDDIRRLASCYWHSVEFGVLQEPNSKKPFDPISLGSKSVAIKAYGAGLLSSFGELEWACKIRKPLSPGEPKPAPSKDAPVGLDAPKLLPWNPSVAAETAFPITTYQPTYFVASSLADAKDKMRDFCEQLNKPFYARYNSLTDSIWVDRNVKCGDMHLKEHSPY